jgi:iron complex outermembrane recepter protein
VTPQVKRPLALLLLLITIAPAPVLAQRSLDLSRATLEQLMDIQITSASRKEQPASDVAGAVFVITQADIRRSGMTTLPEVLRLVPGVQVAQINANKWAVSIRGFTSLYANKLLVLIDGRSIYNRLFAGVLWDGEDPILEDIERIEVIRGPGAAIWGSNAVNGVVNIVTKSAAETRGLMVRIGTGTEEPGRLVARYGGGAGTGWYRVFAQWSSRDDSLLAGGAPARDDWQRASAGFRGDWTSGPRAFTLEGSVTDGHARALWFDLDPAAAGPDRVSPDASHIAGGSVLARWTRTRASGAALQIQSVAEAARRSEPVGEYHGRAADVDLQYHFAATGRHDLVAGAGYRAMFEQFAGRTGYSLTPESSTGTRVNAFAQDEITLAGDRVRVTAGARVERDDAAGWGFQSTARILWDRLPSGQHVWGAVSRALRTPSLQDRGIRVDFPPVAGAGPLPVALSVQGNPDVRTEEFSDVEGGYRVELAGKASVSLTAFGGRYQHLQTSEPQEPVLAVGPDGPYVFLPIRFDSRLAAKTRGVEVDARWTPAAWWEVDATYARFAFTPHPDALSRDAAAALSDGDAPAAQWQLHSGLSFGRGFEFDARLFHVARLRTMGVPAFTRADARVGIPLTAHTRLSFIGQNLLDRAHAEFAGTSANMTPTLVQRSVRVQCTWRF